VHEISHILIKSRNW